MTWDPERSLRYAGERGRPFVELLARVGAEAPRTVVDLGCGPGNLTALLRERWPTASITGVDSSPEMIDRARADHPDLDFRVGDLREWASTAADVDILISNATLQWLPDHLGLLPELVQRVAPGGWFAFQVPGNFEQPSHTILRALAAEESYAGHTRDVAMPSSHETEVYLDALSGLGCSVDVWETTYLHVLTGPDPVFTWVSGTGARPTLETLPPDLRADFEREYKRLLTVAYPTRPDGSVVMPFRRIFVVARVATTRDSTGHDPGLDRPQPGTQR